MVGKRGKNNTLHDENIRTFGLPLTQQFFCRREL